MNVVQAHSCVNVLSATELFTYMVARLCFILCELHHITEHDIRNQRAWESRFPLNPGLRAYTSGINPLTMLCNCHHYSLLEFSIFLSWNPDFVKY